MGEGKEKKEKKEKEDKKEKKEKKDKDERKDKKEKKGEKDTARDEKKDKKEKEDKKEKKEKRAASPSASSPRSASPSSPQRGDKKDKDAKEKKAAPPERTSPSRGRVAAPKAGANGAAGRPHAKPDTFSVESLRGWEESAAVVDTALGREDGGSSSSTSSASGDGYPSSPRSITPQDWRGPPGKPAPSMSPEEADPEADATVPMTPDGDADVALDSATPATVALDAVDDGVGERDPADTAAAAAPSPHEADVEGNSKGDPPVVATPPVTSAPDPRPPYQPLQLSDPSGAAEGGGGVGGGAGIVSDVPAADAAAADWRGVLERFYLQHNPAKVGDIDQLLATYKGHEAKLYEAMVEKYLPKGKSGGGGGEGAAAVKETPVAAAAAAAATAPPQEMLPVEDRRPPSRDRTQPRTRHASTASGRGGSGYARVFDSDSTAAAARESDGGAPSCYRTPSNMFVTGGLQPAAATTATPAARIPSTAMYPPPPRYSQSTSPQSTSPPHATAGPPPPVEPVSAFDQTQPQLPVYHPPLVRTYSSSPSADHPTPLTPAPSALPPSVAAADADVIAAAATPPRSRRASSSPLAPEQPGQVAPRGGALVPYMDGSSSAGGGVSVQPIVVATPGRGEVAASLYPSAAGPSRRPIHIHMHCDASGLVVTPQQDGSMTIRPAAGAGEREGTPTVSQRSTTPPPGDLVHHDSPTTPPHAQQHARGIDTSSLLDTTCPPHRISPPRSRNDGARRAVAAAGVDARSTMYGLPEDDDLEQLCTPPPVTRAHTRLDAASTPVAAGDAHDAMSPAPRPYASGGYSSRRGSTQRQRTPSYAAGHRAAAAPPPSIGDSGSMPTTPGGSCHGGGGRRRPQQQQQHRGFSGSHARSRSSEPSLRGGSSANASHRPKWNHATFTRPRAVDAPCWEPVAGTPAGAGGGIELHEPRSLTHLKRDPVTGRPIRRRSHSGEHGAPSAMVRQHSQASTRARSPQRMPSQQQPNHHHHHLETLPVPDIHRVHSARPPSPHGGAGAGRSRSARDQPSRGGPPPGMGRDGDDMPQPLPSAAAAAAPQGMHLRVPSHSLRPHESSAGGGGVHAPPASVLGMDGVRREQSIRVPSHLGLHTASASTASRDGGAGAGAPGPRRSKSTQDVPSPSYAGIGASMGARGDAPRPRQPHHQPPADDLGLTRVRSLQVPMPQQSRPAPPPELPLPPDRSVSPPRITPGGPPARGQDVAMSAALRDVLVEQRAMFDRLSKETASASRVQGLLHRVQNVVASERSRSQRLEAEVRELRDAVAARGAPPPPPPPAQPTAATKREGPPQNDGRVRQEQQQQQPPDRVRAKIDDLERELQGLCQEIRGIADAPRSGTAAPATGAVAAALRPPPPAHTGGSGSGSRRAAPLLVGESRSSASLRRTATSSSAARATSPASDDDMFGAHGTLPGRVVLA